MEQLFAFFGVGARATVAGRWRGALLLSFVTWAMIQGALFDENWVAGGVEYDFVPPTRRLEGAGAGALAGARPAAAGRRARPAWLPAVALPVGATRLQERFNLGLDAFTLYIDFVFDVTNEKSTYQIVLPLLPFLRQAVAASNAGDAEYGNIVKLNGAKITDVRGLLAAALTFQSFAWAGLLLAAYALAPFKYTTAIAATVRASSFLAALFVFCAVCTFDAAGAKADFCSALDPDALSDGLPCGFGPGFNVACVTIVIGAFAAAAAAVTAPFGVDDAAGSLLGEGKGAGAGAGGEGVPAPEFAGGSFQASSGTGGAAAPGGYQGFGSDSTKPSADL